MKIIKAGYEILTPSLDLSTCLPRLERVGRVCYKSEDKITENSAASFVSSLISRGHEAIIEHESLSVKFIVDRGVSHELVRHRLASWAQESTRYCNYSKDGFGNECTFIRPCFWKDLSLFSVKDQYDRWEKAMQSAENTYFELIKHGATPQEARSVLPNSLKTEVIMTANLREWRHFFRLRTADAAHPQMQEVTRQLLDELRGIVPVIFDDIPRPWVEGE